ncbi:hypothetical protein AB0E67_27500 [Streptomyces sp. NPDC032161]|uniref:hypothetical protein n=1 Tax=unclassified Streptomyces TaxID=2593676 RepID=UPI0033D36B25
MGDTAAHRLRLLQEEFVQPTRSGPGEGRTPTRAHSPALINLGILQQIQAAVREVESHTRAQAPYAGRFTDRNADRVYEWARWHTAHLEPERQQVRETLIYRQSMEHALAAGDTTVVRRHPCPGCGCWGLFWRETQNRAVCVNRYCRDDLGFSRTWTLAHLAQQHISRQNGTAARAT